MVFNGNAGVLLLFFGFAVWITGITVVLLKLQRHYNLIIRSSEGTGLATLLEKVLKKEADLNISLREIGDRVSALESDGTLHLQKIGLVRFNPFSDTGGNQSFSMAILDGKNNGIIMTALYGRSGSRWYLKTVSKGKAVNAVLSKEEESAVKKAQSFEQV